MELRHLRYFVVVAEEQNITRAAYRLHVSQPSLSRQIRDLEEELGVTLFRRTAKSVSLLDAGKIFLQEAREVLLRVDQAVQVTRSVCGGGKGVLKVGYAPSLTTEMLPRVLRLFEEKHSQVKVSLYDLSTQESIQRIRLGKLDVALIAKPMASQMKGLGFFETHTETFCLAVSITHPLGRRKKIKLSQIMRERWIAITEDEYPEYHDFLKEVFQGEGIEPLSIEEYDSATGLMAAVESGRGVALVSSSLRKLSGNRIHLLEIDSPLPRLQVGAITSSKPSSLVKTFVDLAKDKKK